MRCSGCIVLDASRMMHRFCDGVPEGCICRSFIFVHPCQMVSCQMASELDASCRMQRRWMHESGCVNLDESLSVWKCGRFGMVVCACERRVGERQCYFDVR